MEWRIHQVDVKIAFLTWVIMGEVYIEQEQGFEVHERESHVCKLQKALYKLNQEPGPWYFNIDGYLLRLGFTKSDVDSKLYYAPVDSEMFILVFYVYVGILTIFENIAWMCKEEFDLDFEMKEISFMHYISSIRPYSLHLMLLAQEFISQ